MIRSDLRLPFRFSIVALIMLGGVSGFVAGQQVGHPVTASTSQTLRQPERVQAVPGTRQVTGSLAAGSAQLAHLVVATPATVQVTYHLPQHSDASHKTSPRAHTGDARHHSDGPRGGHGHHSGGD